MDFLLYIILLFSNNVETQKGRVIDHEMNDPLTFVMVTSSIDTTYTNLNGEYKIKYHKNDSLTFRFVGYESVKLSPKKYEVIELEQLSLDF